MLYMIVGLDVENSLEKRMSVRPDHVARLKAKGGDGGAQGTGSRGSA